MSQSTAQWVPPDRNRLDEQIVSSIVDAVVGGRHPPGHALPPERELADELGVNRTSLRQAMARLEQIGLIERRQGHGNVVRDPNQLTDPAVVRAMARQQGPDLLAELVELRTALGGFIGRLAAERASYDDIEGLRATLGEVAAATDARSRQDAELAYFGALIRSTRNRALSLLLRWVESAYGDAAPVFAAAFEEPEPVLDGLRRITTAVTRHQPAAAGRAVEAYLHDSGGRLLESVKRAAG